MERLNKQIADDTGGVAQPFKAIDTLAAMERRGTITAGMRQAGETFRAKFNTAHLDPLRAADAADRPQRLNRRSRIPHRVRPRSRLAGDLRDGRPCLARRRLPVACRRARSSERDALAATDAQGHEAPPRAVATHRMDEAGRQNGTRRPDRVAMRDGAALDVDNVFRQAQLARHDALRPRQPWDWGKWVKIGV